MNARTDFHSSVLSSLIAAAVAAIFFASAGCSSRLPPVRPFDAVPIHSTETGRTVVQANLPWQDAAIALKRGDVFYIDAQGEWSGGIGWLSGPSGAVGLDGGRVLVAEQAATALIGRVGDGPAFSVRDQYVGAADRDGPLQLRMNDVTLWDNAGALSATVHIQRREEGALPASPVQAGRPGREEPYAAPTAARTQAQLSSGIASSAAAPESPQATRHGVEAAGAERRTALVIGNAAYPGARLRNTANDAQDVAVALRRLGFDVILRLDVDLRGMETALEEFHQRLKRGGAGLFYFAGHGLQIQGVNWLVPVRARLESESDVRFETLDAGRVLGKMEDAGNGLNIVVLDACRNNPFARAFRSLGRGLAPMDAPTGSLIAYAAAPGATAADGDGRNGVYTKHLLRWLETPDLSILDMFMRVRIGVVEETNRSQTPWESSSLTGWFYFNKSRRREGDSSP